MRVASNDAVAIFASLRSIVFPGGGYMGTDRPAAERELAVFPLLLTNWMQQHGWMPAQPQL